MKTSQKLVLNQFIAKINVFYDDENKCFKSAKGNKINNINTYIFKSFQNVFGRIPSEKETAYLHAWLLTPYDFENVPYKTYLKELIKQQEPSKIRNLKDNYDYYLESIQDSKKAKQCIYISGKSGEGKTTYAQILARKYFNDDEIYFTSGGNNPFDEYYGQKCIIVDDFRDSVIPYNDLLRLLDNNTSSNVGARYHNKSLARCELIILTSVKTPTELYRGIDEERFQLYRRINYFRVSNLKDLEYFKYDKTNDFYKLVKMKNVSKEIQDYFGENENNSIINIDDIFETEVKEYTEKLPF